MWFLVYYLAAINIVTFFTYGFDKWAAKKGWSRVSEKRLHLLSFCGGSIAALIGQKTFHHKTVKSSFQRIFRLILILQIVIIIYLFIKLEMASSFLKSP